MNKIVICLSIATLLFTGCSEKKKEKTELTVPTNTQEKNKLEEKNVTDQKLPNKVKPFKTTLKPHVTQTEVLTKSVDELEINAFKTIQPKIIEAMQKLPECLENAQNKEEAFACSNRLRALNQELAMGMGDLSNETIKSYGEDFVWNEETKVDMIQEIESGTRAMEEMQICIEASKTPEEFAKCIEP